MTYNIIATGSDGNATIVNDEILIDCGVPYKALKPYVKQLRLVLLTHQHSDHFSPSTVARLAHDRPALRFGCCAWMVQDLVDAGVQRTQIDVFGDGWVAYAGFYIKPEKLTHNVENCGWRIDDGEQRLFYATDTGTLDGIEVKGYDFYLVEANHIRAELEARAAEKLARGEYSYEIRAAENHLSMEQAVDWLAENMGPGSIWIPMHGHIDKNGGEKDGGTQDVRKDNRPV
jgi:L-ascorbate metabolism protein UlaG (beta-lactamase superfamily)